MAILDPLTGKPTKVIVKPLKAVSREELAKSKEQAKSKAKPKKKEKKNARTRQSK